MIWSEDALRLESQLHKVFVRNQVNKINLRRESSEYAFDLRGYLELQDIKASGTMAAAAAEFKGSLELEKRAWLRIQ
jgi:hypothetical protein